MPVMIAIAGRLPGLLVGCREGAGALSRFGVAEAIRSPLEPHEFRVAAVEARTWGVVGEERPPSPGVAGGLRRGPDAGASAAACP